MKPELKENGLCYRFVLSGRKDNPLVTEGLPQPNPSRRGAGEGKNTKSF